MNGSKPGKKLIFTAALFVCLAGCQPQESAVLKPAPETAVASTQPKPENWLVGRWAFELSQCGRAQFEFGPDYLLDKTDADGEPVEFLSKPIVYEIAADEIKIDFGSPHQLGGWRGIDGKTTFRKIDVNQMMLVSDRKKISNKLVRCPA